MMTIQKRFLLICHDRSGSNLLRVILGQHPDIYIIPPLPIFEIIYYYRSIYEDLTLTKNWDALLSDVAALYESNHHPLPYSVSYDEIRDRATGAERTLGGAISTVFDILGEKVGRPILGLKFGAYHDMVADFLEQTYFERAIFQFRDPRDVALSVYKAGVDDQSPTDFVRNWLIWHRTIRTLMALRHMPVIEQRYEDLLAKPESILKKVWEFLGVDYYRDALEFYKADEQKKVAATSYMWENVAKPLQLNNKEKFYAEWGWKRTRSLERAIGVQGLEEFGYRPAKINKFPLSSFFIVPSPKRHIRNDKDKEFQRRQNHIALDIQKRWEHMNR